MVQGVLCTMNEPVLMELQSLATMTSGTLPVLLRALRITSSIGFVKFIMYASASACTKDCREAQSECSGYGQLNSGGTFRTSTMQ